MNRKLEIDALKDEKAKLQRQLDDLHDRLSALEKDHEPKPRAPSLKSTTPLRDQILDLLDDAKIPLNSLLLASLMRPLYGRQVPSTRFGTLSNDESKSYESSRARPIYLCHCITYDHGEPVKRFWARSDWPLADRIMGPMTGRVLFMRGAMWVISMSQKVESGERTAVSADTLKYIAADQARDAGIAVKRGEFPYDAWLASIDESLQRLERDDRELREGAAAALSQTLTDYAQLFGSRKGLVSLPGSRPSWRSAME
jgi:hypothetical protein